MARQEARKAEGLTGTKRWSGTAWDLIDWAYRRECVRAAGWESFESAGPLVSSLFSRPTLYASETRGTINGALLVHADAVTVHVSLLKSLGQIGKPRCPACLPSERACRGCTIALNAAANLFRCAEKGLIPGWQVELPEWKRVPVMKGNGKPRYEYDHNRNFLGVMMVETGVRPEVAARIRADAAAVYDRIFDAVAGLVALSGRGATALTDWEVEGIGLPPRAEQIAA